MAVADPADSTGPGQGATGSADAVATDTGSDGSNLGSPDVRVVAEVEPRTPPSSGGGQITDPAESGRDGGRVRGDRKPRRLTIYLPVPQVPRYNGNGTFDYPQESALNFVVIEAPVVRTVKTLGAILQPEPDPVVPPGFRGEEEPPVLEASGGSGSAFTGDVPRVLEAPLVIPRRGPRVAPPPAGANPAGVPPKVGSRADAGVASPIRRAPLASGAEPPPGIAPLGTPAPRQDYKPYLRTATTADIALVALPGLVGLIAMTFSGGVIGYRQASAGRMVRIQGAARFLA